MAKNNTSAFKEDDTKKTLFMRDKTDILVLRSYKEITARLLFSIDLLRRNRAILCN